MFQMRLGDSTIRGKSMKEPRIENKALCVACGGHCCKNYAGCMWPDEFANLDELVEGLADGVLAIDQWEGDPRYDEYVEGGLGCCLFIRPAHKPGTGAACHPVDKVYDNRSYGGECVHLDRDGCRLEWDDRPTQCRMLKPGTKEDGCQIQGKYTKRDAALAWLPHQEKIREAGRAAEAQIFAKS